MIRREELIANSKAHYEADMLLKGTYGKLIDSHFKGCSVGCHLKDIRPDFDGEEHYYDSKHAIVAAHYGYPEWLALLQDTIFEGLPGGENNKWHVQLAEAIAALPDDVNWQTILHRVHVGILRISYATAGEASEAVKTVLDLHERAASGEDISDEMWSAAVSAAEYAAWSAGSDAWSAARSAAWSAAESAAWSAAVSAASSAARSAAGSAVWSERSAAYQEIRDAALDALVGAS